MQRLGVSTTTGPHAGIVPVTPLGNPAHLGVGFRRHPQSLSTMHLPVSAPVEGFTSQKPPP